jgi:hypothetical protein
MTSDSAAPKLDFVSEMQVLLGEELGHVTIARLERLRYSQSPADEADLSLALAELGDGFRSDEVHDPAQRAVLLDYLCGWVADPGLSWIARVGAIDAIAGSGSWEAIRKAAAASFQPGTPTHVPEMALGPLMDAARSDPARRAEALELLRQFAAQVPASAAKLNVDAYIAELTE